jgi:hypothetical protein
MKSVPIRLLELIADRKIVPFIGAGFSIPSGVPSWHSIVNGLVNNFAPEGKHHLIEELSNLIGKPDVAEVIDSITPTEFATKEYLIEQVNSPKYRPSEYHDYLIELHCDTIITTNWDTLIETAAWNNHQPCHVICRDSDVAQYDPDREMQLLKIHGTILDHDSLIYRKSHYEQFWEKRPLLFDLLATLMATKSFLFLGYGFGDPNILEVIHKLRDRLGKARREHYALVFSRSSLTRAWQDLGVTIIEAPSFDPNNIDGGVGVLEFLHELSGKSRGIAITNLERAKLINQELSRLIKRMPPKPILRMRGSLGWLSNPVPVSGDPIYGSDVQDLEERQMTDLVCRFFDSSSQGRMKCILHLNFKPLIRRGYKPLHLLRRLETVKEMLDRYGQSIEIVHDTIPSNLNHMFFDDQCSLLGFKKSEGVGIDRTVLVRNRAVVRAEAQLFDEDFEAIMDRNKIIAEEKGISTQQGDWLNVLIKTLVEEQLVELTKHVNDYDLNTSIPISSGESRGYKLPEGAILLSHALEFACRKHGEYAQTREDGVTPYAVHVIRVVERLRSIALVDDYEILAAAALHDVVEDCNVPIDLISEQFGQRVAGIVSELSASPNQTPSQYLDQIKGARKEAKIVKLADRWDNIVDLRNFHKERFGEYFSIEYLQWSKLMLEACENANPKLALSLKNEIVLGLNDYGVSEATENSNKISTFEQG